MTTPNEQIHESKADAATIKYMMEAVNDMTANIPAALAIFASLMFKIITFHNFDKARPQKIAHFSVTMPPVDNKPAWVWVTFDEEIAKKVAAVIREHVEGKSIIHPGEFKL